RRFPLLTACVTKTRSPQTIGEELPRSGNSAFHRTFSVALHCNGRFSSVEIPVPVGPRQPGQFVALSVVATESTAANERTGRTEEVFMRRVIGAASPVNPALI